jgi:hypothetical protein
VLTNKPLNALPAGTAGIAPDPLAYITIFEALEKQVGLKLAQQKISDACRGDRSRRTSACGKLIPSSASHGSLGLIVGNSET